MPTPWQGRNRNGKEIGKKIFEVEGGMHRGQRSGAKNQVKKKKKMPESAFFCQMRLEQKRERRMKLKSGYSS